MTSCVLNQPILQRMTWKGGKWDKDKPESNRKLLDKSMGWMVVTWITMDMMEVEVEGFQDIFLRFRVKKK